jgi:2-polyprenyl-6-methoxyphenol hydroxylase-like FAD-dependent oxidoreductase
VALAPCFDEVVVLERSEIPDAAVPREGVPQGRHPHVLLGGGQRALEQLLPGFERELSSAGAVAYRVGLDTRYERPGFDPFPRRDLGWTGFALSRPLLELVLRRRAHVGNVQLWPECPVERVLASHGGERVVGVQLGGPGGRRIGAELVIDASGSGKPTLQALEAGGLPAPAETRIDVDMGYTSAIFAVPEDVPDWKVLMVLSDAPKSSRGAVLTPLEGGRWFVLVAGRHAEKPPGDWDGFFGFARQLRTATLARALQRARPLGDVKRFGFPASVWRHYERSTTLPVGILPIGDAVCRFNPVYGQGMSVAAQQALLLRSALSACAEHSDPLQALAPEFLGKLAALIETPWSLAAAPDFVYPETRGERPPSFSDNQRFNAALLQLAARDGDVHRTMLQVQHLLRPIGDLRTPELRERVRALMPASA